MARTQKALARSLERLSSGSRLTSARDDVAGMAQSVRLTAKARELTLTARAVTEAGDLLQVASAALTRQREIVDRIRELALSAANELLTEAERSGIQQEIDGLYQDFQRVVNETRFNDRKLLDGSYQTTLGTSADAISLSIGNLSSQRIFENIEARGQGTFRIVSSFSPTV